MGVAHRLWISAFQGLCVVVALAFRWALPIARGFRPFRLVCGGGFGISMGVAHRSWISAFQGLCVVVALAFRLALPTARGFRPFRACVWWWLWHFDGRCPPLVDFALSGGLCVCYHTKP